MTTELTVLGYAALLQMVQFVLMAVPVNLHLGVKYTSGPRDTPAEHTKIGGRLVRAFDNHFQALILFTIAVLIVTLGDQSTPLTQTCAWVYLAARVAYVPAYVAAIPMLRSMIWFAGLLATFVMLVSTLILGGTI